jgi:class 3 adenylate cyclase
MQSSIFTRDKKRWTELGYFALLILWFFLPLIWKGESTLNPSLLGAEIAPGRISGVLLVITAWLVPLASVWRILQIALRDKSPRSALLAPRGPLPLALGFLASLAVIVLHVVHLAAWAYNASYFAGLGPFSIVVLALSIACNARTLAAFLSLVDANEESQKELTVFRSEQAARARTSEARRYSGIQKRLFESFLSLIIVIIVVICALLFRNFSRTLQASIAEAGQSIVGHAASMAKSSPGDGKDHISRDDYIRDEARKNEKSAYPFRSLSYYRYDSRKSAFTASESTDPSLLGTSIDEKSAKAAGWIESPDRKRISFFAPVLMSGKTLGVVAADYDRDVLYGPYFNTQMTVIAVALCFIYIAVFITYLLGKAIVTPLLFLNMNVNRISTNLSGMISGREKISIDLLQYKDPVKTRDEIKGLSVEIDGMTRVIRGVVPYISASTLKSVDRRGPSTDSRDLAFLFTDIRGFTTLCEGRSPEDVVQLLNHYLDIQSALILENGGDIDKFVGDEIMAMFEGPDKERNACRAGIAIRDAMAREKEMAKAANRHVVSIGIGIHSGPVVFGSVGARNRMDFTSIGDTVNLAARLEGVNKVYGTKALITETVREKVGNDFLCRELDLITVKGKTKPVRIYEVLDPRSKILPARSEFAAGFEAALAAYRNQNWDEAEKRFRKLADAHQDAAAAVFLDRIALFRAAPPPADWNGVFTLTAK